MEDQIAMARHPIHPMLVPFPIALWLFSLAGDCMYLFGFGGPVWKDIALYSMAAGVAGGLVAAVPAYYDYRGITDPVIAHMARRHMSFNALIVLLYGINVALRLVTGEDAWVPVAASVVGLGLLLVSVWWGGEFTYAEGVRLADEVMTRGRRAA